MIDQLPDALTQAASWSEYRKVLHRLRDASGITMRGLHPAALEQGFTDAPKTFTRVVAADDTKPDKRQVEILVQVCTAYAREVKRREALRLFMEAYQRLETAAAAPPASPEFTGPSAEQTAPSLPIEAAVSAPTTPAVTGSPVSAEEAAVVLTEPPDERSWWRKRSRTQKVLFTASALATVASTVFGVVHLSSDQATGKKTVTQSSSKPRPSSPANPSPAPSTPSPSASRSSAAGGTGNNSDAGSASGGSQSGSGSSLGGSGAASGGTAGSEGREGAGRASSPTPSPSPSPAAVTTFAAKIQYTDDLGGGCTEDTVACKSAWVYWSPLDDGANTKSRNLGENTPITVTCVITNGRRLGNDVGPTYRGPTPIPYTTWLKMKTGEWATAVYAELLDNKTIDDLPPCS